MMAECSSTLGVNAVHAHLFVSSDGALFDTRRADWSANPLRVDYCKTFAKIRTGLELRATLRAGGFAWPGGYPLYFITSDGAALSFESVRAEFRQCAYSIRHNLRDGWRIVACAVNYEDSELTCEHSGAPIQSAYGE
jgi:hypothetical protein